jgi:hypothetical protein
MGMVDLIMRIAISLKLHVIAKFHIKSAQISLNRNKGLFKIEKVLETYSKISFELFERWGEGGNWASVGI